MSTRSPARLIVALAVAAVLSVFLLYTAIAGKSTPQFNPSQLRGHSGPVSVVGDVVGPVAGDSHSARGLRFGIRNRSAGTSPVVRVVYHGDTPPPLFKVGREVIVAGTFAGGSITATGLVTKCPSKYTAKPST